MTFYDKEIEAWKDKIISHGHNADGWDSWHLNPGTLPLYPVPCSVFFGSNRYNGN